MKRKKRRAIDPFDKEIDDFLDSIFNPPPMNKEEEEAENIRLSGPWVCNFFINEMGETDQAKVIFGLIYPWSEGVEINGRWGFHDYDKGLEWAIYNGEFPAHWDKDDGAESRLRGRVFYNPTENKAYMYFSTEYLTRDEGIIDRIKECCNIKNIEVEIGVETKNYDPDNVVWN